MKPTPTSRIRAVNASPRRPDRDWVLYWMIAARRPGHSFGLQRAVEQARDLGKPLVVLEALRAGYRWASDRIHAFVIEGMRDNERAFARGPATYLPYVEPAPGAGRGLLEALAARSAVVVTDEFPCFFLPRMVAAAGRKLDVLLEAVDSNGLLPLSAAERDYPTAYAFRRFLQKTLPDHLEELPEDDPLRRARLPRVERLPEAIARRWSFGTDVDLARLPIDHDVPEAEIRGGARAGEEAIERFLDERLARYPDERNEPERDAASGLSPYLHFGHVSVHDVFRRLALREGWSPASLSGRADGKRAGFWGMGRAAEAFLDELVTWRELGYVFSARRSDYDRFSSLPDWARKTLAAHASDPRRHLYDVDGFARSATHDPLWNAAQTQLVREGRMHNYLRMLWGKKILEWTATPEDALEVMVELNNKYALDGRNPNSYSGIFWVLGRFDRPWGPEREIFGTVRYMSSENTARKLSVKEYVRRYSGPQRMLR